VSREQWWKVLSALSRGDINSWDLHAAQGIQHAFAMSSEEVRRAMQKMIGLI
jgi:hypothetical protein